MFVRCPVLRYKLFVCFFLSLYTLTLHLHKYTTNMSEFWCPTMARYISSSRLSSTSSRSRKLSSVELCFQHCWPSESYSEICRVKDSPSVSCNGCFEAATTLSLRHKPFSCVISMRHSIWFVSRRVRVQTMKRLFLVFFPYVSLKLYGNTLTGWVFKVHVWEYEKSADSDLAWILTELKSWPKSFVLIYCKWFVFSTAGNPQDV
jgi:hypothetical protein